MFELIDNAPSTPADTFNDHQVACRHRFRAAAGRGIVGTVVVHDTYLEGEMMLWSEIEGWPHCEGWDGDYNLTPEQACERLEWRYTLYSATSVEWREKWDITRRDWSEALSLDRAREWRRSANKLVTLAEWFPGLSVPQAASGIQENPHNRLVQEVEDLFTCMLQIVGD